MGEKCSKQLPTLDAADNIPFWTLNGLTFNARVVDCYDGDTITCVIKYPNNKYYKFKIRMVGYDSPEMKPSKKIKETERIAIKKAAVEARDFLASQILSKQVVLVCSGEDKYGRTLGKIYKNKHSKQSLNELMIEKGHGYVYNGGSKKKPPKQFLKESMIVKGHGYVYNGCSKKKH